MVNIKEQFEKDNQSFKVRNLFVLNRKDDVVNKMLLLGQYEGKEYFVAVSELKSGKWSVGEIQKYDSSIRAIESFARQKKANKKAI